MDPIERTRAALADRYAIQSELGSGGMATVYFARDLKHDRNVAVKVLRPELAAAVGSERFLREIRITAQLNHPHVLPLLDSGEADGVLYYVMPYAAGGSLRGLLTSGRALALDEIMRITHQVASALDHAHRHGVLHRDVKPENVLFSEGMAIVSDFGIARVVSAAGREALTRTGFPLGTPGYMSPEQAMGITELDAGTDVYSLASVVYEMLIGETPAALPSPDDGRVGRLLDAPPEHRERLDRLPGRVEQALVKALAIRPADRFAAPGEFAEALAAAAEGSTQLSETEVDAVLRRASELQARQPTEGSALSIGAVEQVAAEVGIPPEHVRDAVKELSEAEHPSPPASLTLGRTRLEYQKETLILDRTVDREITESANERLVDTWSPASPGTDQRKIVATITRAADRTHIHIEERFELSGWRIFVPAWGVGAGVILGVLTVAALGLPDRAMLLALMLAPVGGFSSVFLFLRGSAARRKPQLLELADRLAAIIERSEPQALGPGNSGSDARRP